MTPNILDQIGLELPILQAAMGGGISGPELVTEVSLAGGLGSLGMTPIAQFRQDITAIQQQLEGRSYAVNLLMPFTTRAHVRCCIEQRVPVVSIFYGFKSGLVDALKQAGCRVLYQVGTVNDAERALGEGADGLIIQGHEAGGHLSSKERLETLLPKVHERFPATFIFAAGGVHNNHTANRLLSLGANGVAVGTRFLMSPESGAHPLYKQKLVSATDTLVTHLFGTGWYAPHRVIANAASRKWLHDGEYDKPLVRGLNRVVEHGSKYMPAALQDWIYHRQNLHLPFYSPTPPTTRHSQPPVECSALYAGECAAAITSLKPAAQTVRDIMGIDAFS